VGSGTAVVGGIDSQSSLVFVLPIDDMNCITRLMFCESVFEAIMEHLRGGKE
jgi:hypothetical protein